MRRSQLAAICGVVILMSWPSARVLYSDLPLYTVEDLGTLNGVPLTPRSINASGHVVGKADTADGRSVGFLLDSQPARGLGSEELGFTDANAINDKDEVVGFTMGSDGYPRALRYAAATGTRALVLPDGYLSAAFGINASGQITGYAGQSTYHAFRYLDGSELTDLGTLGGFASYGYGINDSGQVTGCSWTADFQKHAFVWDGVNPMLDLGVLGGSQSCGVSINRAGQVAGWSLLFSDERQHAFRYSAGAGLQDLGTLGGLDSAATALNDDGTVVGWSTDVNGERRAFVFTDAEGLIDLNTRINATLGWVLTDATSINAGGQIVGFGLLGGEVHAFRLTPPPAVTPARHDTTPPAIRSIRTSPYILWPPHREMVPVRVHVAAKDDVDPAPSCRITNVTSSQPDAGTSRLDRPHDIVVRGDLALRLRAELVPGSHERTYTIDVACADAAGNQTTSQTAVRVVLMPWGWFRR